MNKNKVIIAGGRDFDDYKMLKEKCDYYLKNISDQIEIVSGTASGADRLGERYAAEKGYDVKQFPANWEIHKRSAGIMRNIEMADYSNFLIAFHDGFSRGTAHMIQVAKEKGLKVAIVKY